MGTVHNRSEPLLQKLRGSRNRITSACAFDCFPCGFRFSSVVVIICDKVFATILNISLANQLTNGKLPMSGRSS